MCSQQYLILKYLHRSQPSDVPHVLLVQSAGALEYTDCISCKGVRHSPPYECRGYDIKPSDSKASALEIWGI